MSCVYLLRRGMDIGMTADPKPLRRIRDPEAMRRAHRAGDCCVVNAHHVVSRARGGDDITDNLVLLCGSGTTGCHGEFHAGVSEVAKKIGEALTPAHILYVRTRLGDVPGRMFLRREYLLEVV